MKELVGKCVILRHFFLVGLFYNLESDGFSASYIKTVGRITKEGFQTLSVERVVRTPSSTGSIY